MATLAFTIPDKQLAEVTDALAYSFYYSETISEDDGLGQLVTVPNPESKQAFVKRSIAEELKNRVKQAKAEMAAEEAAKAAMRTAEENTEIT